MPVLARHEEHWQHRGAGYGQVHETIKCKRKKNELTVLLNLDRVTRIALELKRVGLVEIEEIKPTLQIWVELDERKTKEIQHFSKNSAHARNSGHRAENSGKGSDIHSKSPDTPGSVPDIPDKCSDIHFRGAETPR